LGRFKRSGPLQEKKEKGMEWAAGLERRRGKRFGFVFFSSFSTLYS
jgi:hypothetical protein